MIDMEFFTIMTTVLEIYFYFLFFHLFTPYPAFPHGGRSQRQAGSFAKIAHRAIFKRSALPWGKMKGGWG